MVEVGRDNLSGVGDITRRVAMIEERRGREAKNLVSNRLADSETRALDSVVDLGQPTELGQQTQQSRRPPCPATATAHRQTDSSCLEVTLGAASGICRLISQRR
jgi:hypothetical protein